LIPDNNNNNNTNNKYDLDEELTVRGGPSCRWGLDFRWSPRSDVAVAPRQLLFTVELCAETGGIAPVVPGEEGASLSGEEGGLLCRCDRTTANTVCVLRER